MNKALLLFFFISPLNLFAMESFCRFEEVYKNGSTQQGFFLLKNDKIRYEYLDKNLFTIIIKDDKSFFIPNNQKDSFRIIDESNELINNLAGLLIDFPHIDYTYSSSEYSYTIEKSSNNFIKRIAIRSKELNISINFLNCEFKDIHDKYFMHFPFRPYIL